MPLAIVREVSTAINRCELTHVDRVPIDVERARRQHHEYVNGLRSLGCEIEQLPEQADQPDSVFVEDAAVVLDEVAIITRPGAPSRRAETATVEAVLGRYRPIRRVEAPGTIDGGDVLRVGRKIFVGVSGRSNEAAICQLREIAEEYDYEVFPVAVRGCLHLKSAATLAAPDTLLVNPAWLPGNEFGGYTRIEVDASEPMAANGLRLGDRLLYASAFPRTLDRLEARGIRTHLVDVSELAKAEGAITCCSIILSMPDDAG